MAYLRVGFADYELCPVEQGNKNLLHNGVVCAGTVDHYNHTIHYRDDFNGQCQLQTILHECFHIADWQAGHYISEECDKEAIIDRYANFMLQFMRDNTEFTTLIKDLFNTKEVKKVACGKKKGKGK